jgi:YHS domain-containing protein
VSYIKDKKAEKGSKAFALLYNEAVYCFSFAATKEVFKKSPVRYVPNKVGTVYMPLGKMAVLLILTRSY